MIDLTERERLLCSMPISYQRRWFRFFTGRLRIGVAGMLLFDI
jgi:hypothetical protein